jgi:predicted PurR-regulated permease PerM
MAEKITTKPQSPAALILFALGCVIAIIAIWWLREAFLLAFASIVLAIALSAAAAPLLRTKLPRPWAVLIALAIIFAVLGLAGWLVGAQISAQLGQLYAQLPKAVQSLEQAIGLSLPSASEIVSGGGSSSFLSGVLGTIATWGWTVAGVATTLFLVLMGAVFLALNPGVYRRGALKLVPERYRDRVDEAMDKSADGLRLWLFGQLISMALIGGLVTLGTWALGLPAPLALGIIAGLAAFVPMLGAVAGAIPAVLLATTEGMNMALWTILLFVIIQQVESNIVMPQVQREMIRIPPALFLFSVLAFGILFGMFGVLLAGPLTVAVFVLVRWAVD